MAFPIYIQADSADFDAPLDLRRSATPEFWAGSAIEFHICVFEFGVLRAVSDLASLSVEIKAKGDRDTAPLPGAAPLMSKTVTAFDSATTEAEWYAYTHCHALVSFSAAETAIPAGTHWLVVSALTKDATPQSLTLAAGEIVVAEDGHGTVGEIPIENGTGYTKAESDARYARVGLVGSSASGADLSVYESRIATLETAAASDDSRLDSAESAISRKANTSDVTTALAAKAALSHTHAQEDVTGLSDALSAKANVSDVATSLALKANASDMTTALALKANTADVTSALSGKAATSHSHAQSDVTGLAAALAAKADAATGGATISATSYTLALTDAGTVIEFSAASAVTVTVPTHATVALSARQAVTLVQAGSGQITVAGASGVTVLSTATLKSYGQGAVLTLIRSAAADDTWILTGERALS